MTSLPSVDPDRQQSQADLASVAQAVQDAMDGSALLYTRDDAYTVRGWIPGEARPRGYVLIHRRDDDGWTGSVQMTGGGDYTPVEFPDTAHVLQWIRESQMTS